MKKIALLILVPFVLISCNQEVNLTFSETNFSFNKNAIIEINIPNADGANTVSKAINSTIENFIVNTISFSEDSLTNVSLNEAVKKFDSIYISFKDDFEENTLVWEALIDGEVTYQSPALTCIAINSYLNTGGAHGNMTIAMNHTRMIGRYQGNGNSQIGLFTQQIFRIEHLEGQAQNSGNWRQGYIALVPSQRQTEAFFAVVLSLANDASVYDRACIATRFRTGQAEAGNLGTLC